MELKYIWIKKYKNLETIGFNIIHSKQDRFDFIDGTIKISKSEGTQPENFFGGNYNGVTSIVGENGTGKTNLSEFMHYCLAHVTNGGHSTYRKIEGLLIIDDWIFVQEDIGLINEDELIVQGYTISKFKNAPLDNGQGEMRWHKMEKNKYIYYCPQFDQRLIDVHENLINISTTYLVYNDNYNSRKSHVNWEGERNLQFETDELTAHYRMELSRQAELILFYDNISEFIDFIPNMIQVGIDHESENRLIGWKWKGSLDKETTEPLDEYQNTLNRELDSLESHQLNQFRELTPREIERSSIKYYTIPIEIRKSTFIRLFFLKVFRVLLNVDKVIFPDDFCRSFIYNEEKESVEDRELMEKLVSLRSRLNELIDLVEWKEIEMKFNDSSYSNKERLKKDLQVYNFYRNIILDIDKVEQKELLITIIEDTKEVLSGKSILNYELLSHYSSGEQLLLSFYSRFFYAKNEILERDKEDFGIDSEAIVIVIDEGETSLHPEWQRVYFNKISTYLSSLFNDYTIQLILITHSPIVLSDIPTENILFLKKDENSKTFQFDAESESTLGANIHDLLSNSYFVSSTIGAFAEKKIKEIINFYYKFERGDISETIDSNLVEEYNEKRNEFRYTVKNLGDPVIKNILNNHLTDIEGRIDANGYRNIRIKELENEIKKLKSEQDD